MKLKDNENLVVLGIFLGLTGLFSALVLAVVSHFTARPIAEAAAKREDAALRQVLPVFDNDIKETKVAVKSPAGWQVQFMTAGNNGKIAGYAATVSNPAGYAGKITMLAGLNTDGTIRALLVTEHNETPGLGAEICKREFRKTVFNLTEPQPDGLAPNKYLDQFNGRKVPSGGWSITKDGGDAVYATGATVTGRAVVKSASEITAAFIKNREKINAAFRRDK